jgi:hypothetical protein
VTLGKILASAERTASMRGVMVAMPWLTLPAIDPEASNTSMASSTQGLRSESSACAKVGTHHRSVAKPIAVDKEARIEVIASGTLEQYRARSGVIRVAGLARLKLANSGQCPHYRCL